VKDTNGIPVVRCQGKKHSPLSDRKGPSVPIHSLHPPLTRSLVNRRRKWSTDVSSPTTKFFAIQKTFIAEDGKGNEIFRIRKRFARTSPPLSLSHGVKGRTDCWQLGRRRKRRSEMRARGMMSRWSSEVTFGEGARISLSLEVEDQEEEGVGVDGWWRRSRGNCGMRGRSLGINRL